MLINWIKGVNKEDSLKNSSFNITSFIHGEEFPVLENYSIAIISSSSDRSKYIKESLGLFKNHFNSLNIIDLGYFRKDDPLYNVQLIRELHESQILPIIIDQDFRWYSAIVHALDENISLKNICCSNTILFSEYGTPCEFIGFQRHLTEIEHLSRIAEHSINSMSLGKMRAEQDIVEPALRDKNYFYFDIAAFKKADAPGSFSSMPSGLSCEEGCQISKYIGMSTNLKLFVIGGDFSAEDNTCNNIAQLLWYFIEGLSTKTSDYPINNNYKEYVVENEEIETSLHFVKSNDSNRWWFKHLNENDEITFTPCAYSEYKRTIEGEFPPRLWGYYTKVTRIN